MDIWETYWVNKKHNPVLVEPPELLYGGTNTEPLASKGMSCFIDASRDKFVEGFTILDYGCGAGILSNFISERLSSFNYYGVETSTQHGIGRIDLGKNYFNDKRIFFGFIDSDLDFILTKKLDMIVLISVFTHLKINDTINILDKLVKIFDTNHDCDIVFSCFISEEEMVENHQPHIWDRFYGVSYIKESDLIDYCKKNNFTIKKHITFTAQGGYNHEIFKIKKLCQVGTKK